MGQRWTPQISTCRTQPRVSWAGGWVVRGLGGQAGEHAAACWDSLGRCRACSDRRAPLARPCAHCSTPPVPIAPCPHLPPRQASRRWRASWRRRRLPRRRRPRPMCRPRWVDGWVGGSDQSRFQRLVLPEAGAVHAATTGRRWRTAPRCHVAAQPSPAGPPSAGPRPQPRPAPTLSAASNPAPPAPAHLPRWCLSRWSCPCGRACCASTLMAGRVRGGRQGRAGVAARHMPPPNRAPTSRLLPTHPPPGACPTPSRPPRPADGRSVRTILQHVAPRHCVLVHGAAEATAALAGYLRTELAGLHTAVYTPQAGEEVELPVEAAYHLALRCDGSV